MKKMATIWTVVAMCVGAAVYAQAPLAGQAASSTLARAQPQAKRPEAKPTPEVKPAAEALPASPKDGVKIGVVKEIKIVGDEAFAASENVAEGLAAALCDGQEKTVRDLRVAMDEAKRALVGRGFYLTRIGPSRADAFDEKTGALELLVDPGRFGDVKVAMKSGENSWYGEDLVLKRFKHVKKGDPFDYTAFRQAMRGVNGHPDLLADAKLSLRAEDGTRYADAELTVEDSFPLHATLDFNNYAMEELDDWQAILTLQYLNLTGADDVLTVSPGVTLNGDMWSVASSYLRPFDFLLGGSWSVFGGYSDMDCDEVMPRLDLEGIGGFAGFNVSFNLYDDAKRNVSLNAGVTWRYLEDQWDLKTQSLKERDLNVVPVTVGLGYADKRRDWLGGLDFVSVSESVNVCGDKKRFHAYSEEADVHYTVFRGSWARLQPVYGPKADGEEWRCWSLFGKAEGQYTHNTLISAERLAYGGNACLRGYRRRGYLGDSGVYGTLEARTPVFCDPLSRWFRDTAGKSPFERVQLFAFTDMGGVHYNTTYANMERSEVLWSWGVGARAALTKYLSLNVDVAFPLEKAYAHDEDDTCEVYLSVKAQW